MCTGVRVFIYLHMASYMYVYIATYAHAYNIKMIYIGISPTKQLYSITTYIEHLVSASFP